MSSTFEETFRRAVSPSSERLLAGVALAAAGSGMNGEACKFSFASFLTFNIAETHATRVRGKATSRTDQLLLACLDHHRYIGGHGEFACKHHPGFCRPIAHFS